MKKILGLLCTILFVFIMIKSGEAILYRGVEFPDGAISFADAVVSYNPGPYVGAFPYSNPQNALGPPDWIDTGDYYVSLGDEGELVLQFTDNSLTTSGDDSEDLWVFEIGDAIEPTAVAISTNGTDWIGVGATSGATSGIDIDAYIGSGVDLYEKYSFVKITDLLPNQSGSPYGGADIDAVGAISSAPPVNTVPEPSSWLLLCSILIGMLGIKKKFSY